MSLKTKKKKKKKPVLKTKTNMHIKHQGCQSFKWISGFVFLFYDISSQFLIHFNLLYHNEAQP